jgi:hypothetical protein
VVLVAMRMLPPERSQTTDYALFDNYDRHMLSACGTAAGAVHAAARVLDEAGPSVRVAQHGGPHSSPVPCGTWPQVSAAFGHVFGISA